MADKPWSDGTFWTDTTGWADDTEGTSARSLQHRRWLYWPSAAAGYTGPLDALTSGLVGAWSTGRKLVSSYAGAGLAVVETGGNTSADISYNATTGATDTTLATHIGANNGFVDKLYDHSGTSRDLLANNVNARMRIANAGSIHLQNGHPYCTTAIDSLRCYKTNTFTAYTGTTLSGYAVFALGGLSQPYHRIFSGLDATNNDSNGPGGGAFIVRNDQSTSVLTAYRSGGSLAPTGVPYGGVGAFVAVGFRFTGSSFVLRSGASSSDTAASSAAFALIQLTFFMSNSTDAYSELGTSLCEAAIWTSDIGATALSSVLADARTYWGAS